LVKDCMVHTFRPNNLCGDVYDLSLISIEPVEKGPLGEALGVCETAHRETDPGGLGLDARGDEHATIVACG